MPYHEIQHIGLHVARTSREPDEARFAKHWKALVKSGHNLTGILDDKWNERDATVAATVIQWLGSPVGQNFLEECGFVKKTR
jgi:hypothetical protein